MLPTPDQLRPPLTSATAALLAPLPGQRASFECAYTYGRLALTGTCDLRLGAQRAVRYRLYVRRPSCRPRTVGATRALRPVAGGWCLTLARP